MPQRRNRDDAGRHHRGRSRCHGRPAPPPHAPAAPHGPVDRRLPRGNGPDRQVEPFVQAALVVDAHWKPPSTSSALCRRVASARDAWLLTVPTEQLSSAAVSVSDRPSQ